MCVYRAWPVCDMRCAAAISTIYDLRSSIYDAAGASGTGLVGAGPPGAAAVGAICRAFALAVSSAKALSAAAEPARKTFGTGSKGEAVRDDRQEPLERERPLAGVFERGLLLPAADPYGGFSGLSKCPRALAICDLPPPLPSLPLPSLPLPPPLPPALPLIGDSRGVHAHVPL